MEFLLVVTLLVLVLGISSALLPFAAFRNKLTRPFRHVHGKTARIRRS